MLFLIHYGAKHSFQERVVLHDWISCKTHFSARICDNLAKRCFQLTMAQNTVFKKEFYFMMQNVFFSEKWFKFGKTRLSTHNGGKHRFPNRFVFHEWI